LSERYSRMQFVFLLLLFVSVVSATWLSDASAKLRSDEKHGIAAKVERDDIGLWVHRSLPFLMPA